MNTVMVTIEVGDPEEQRFQEEEVAVNASRMFTKLPKDLLHRMGVPARRQISAKLADGQMTTVCMG